MSPQGRFWGLMAAAGLLGGLVLLAAVTWLLAGVDDPLLRQRVAAATAFAALGEGLALGLLGVAVHRRLLRPAQQVAHRLLATGDDDADDLRLPPGHLLGQLPKAVAQVLDSLRATRSRMRDVRSGGAEEQRARLETVLRGLDEGVIVCDTGARVLLYNPAARRLLGHTEALGLGRSLFDLWAREPVEHTLAVLHRRREQQDADEPPNGAEFVTATLDDGALLHCRLGLLPEGGALGAGFVLTFEDVTRGIEDLAQRDRNLRRSVDALRPPLAAIRAAAESLGAAASDPAQREAFERLLVEESRCLAERFERVAEETQRFVPVPWTTADVYSADLVASILRRRRQRPGGLALLGRPEWLHADSHALGRALEHLMERLAAERGADEFGIETVPGDSGVYLDLVWRGDPVAVATLERWAADPVPGTVGAVSVRDVLEHHGSDLWSEPHRRRVGHSVIRLPLPAARDIQSARPSPRAGSRPEVWDAVVRDLPASSERLDTPLRELSFTVFDTETTGLHPDAGDEIISIAGVRIVQGRLVPEETFDRLVHPRRRIPAESARFHGITDAQVAEAPPLGRVLPAFRRFAGDDVMVAHNADFDMRFLRLKEDETGIRLDNPVLDTLLMSLCLDAEAPDHTLEGIARRLGVEINGRHTALGDALATARIFLHLLDLAEAAGMVTLGQALEATEHTLQLRLRQARR